MVALLPAEVTLLRPARGLPSATSTSVPDVVLGFFLGGAVGAVAVVFVVLAFNVWCFQFLPPGIVFAGSMSAIYLFKLVCAEVMRELTIPHCSQFQYHCCSSVVNCHRIHPRKQELHMTRLPYQYQ